MHFRLKRVALGCFQQLGLGRPCLGSGRPFWAVLSQPEGYSARLFVIKVVFVSSTVEHRFFHDCTIYTGISKSVMINSITHFSCVFSADVGDLISAMVALDECQGSP